MVYYQQQNVALLAQISRQVSSISPQVSIPSTLPPPYPAFRPNSSDVRINVYWFMSLVFSLFAALLATLVQQWVRDYMHVFQRYSNPLKSARLRQYLYEGAEGWYMPVVAEAVPGLVHVSLFLFFLGLGDSLLSVNTTVGVTSIVPITICGFLYILSMFAPILNPQSPFRNPFSGLIWHLKQKMHPRRYIDRASGGSIKAVSSILSEGQMQLAMEENDERKYRDVRAIQWLIHNRTEDDEMESFVMAIPGSFTSKWGIDVWRKASEVKHDEDTNLMTNDLTVRSQNDATSHMPNLPHHRSPPSQRISLPLRLGRVFGIRVANRTSHDLTRFTTHLLSETQSSDDPHLAVHNLCKRVRHLVDTCDNHSIFTNQGLWLNRARGCIETVASLVFCADINPELFGELERLLPPLRRFILMEARHISAPGSDGLFRNRFECLSFVFAKQGKSNHGGIQQRHARLAIDSLSRYGMEADGEQENHGDSDEIALRNARRIDDYFETARQFCVYGIRGAISPSGVETTEEQAREVLARDHEADISMLERIALVADPIANIDRAIFDVIHMFSHGFISYVRGAHFDMREETKPIQPNQFFNPHPLSERPFFLPQFIYLHQRLRLLCSYSPKIRDFIDGQRNGTYEDMLESLKTLWAESDKPTCQWSAVRRQHLMERQFWRLQDLRDEGGFGFWVELFFIMAQQLIVIPLSPDAHSSLTIGTFRNISSNWKQHKHSIGTQRVILNLVCDIAIPGHGLLSDLGFPSYITDELLKLLENMFEGQSGSHIDEAIQELEAARLEVAVEEQGHTVTCQRWTEIRPFREEAIKVLRFLHRVA